MKFNARTVALSAIAFAGANAVSAQEIKLLEGDTRLACEAILCLVSGTRPEECTPSLKRYFSINHRKLRDTLRARANFLKMCPDANKTPEMASLVDAIANGAGRCDAATLNATQQTWSGIEGDAVYISNVLPSHCASYTQHQYVDAATLPAIYVGVPEQGGFWVEAQNYEAALAEYNAKLATQTPPSSLYWNNR